MRYRFAPGAGTVTRHAARSRQHGGSSSLRARQPTGSRTVPGKGWFTILRIYSPLEGYFDKSWQIGEIELMQ